MLDARWLDLLFALLAVPGATVQCFEILRVQSKNRYWLAALVMLPVMIIAGFTGAQVRPLSLAAAALWAVFLLACITHKRRLGLACVVLCGFFAVSSKLAGFAAQRSSGVSPRAPTNVSAAGAGRLS